VNTAAPIEPAHHRQHRREHPASTDREEVFMPTEKSKPSQDPKSKKDKKSSELREDDLRSVSGGLVSTGGVVGGVGDTCLTAP
jgi:hypothetical protein